VENKYQAFQQIEERAFYALVAFLGLIVLLGLGAWHHMETHGHVVTGMTNQIVWGLPHVFAVLLIVAASGVLNVASIGSVFGRTIYKARAPLSGLLALALLAGGLFVLVLDLGRSDRLIVAMTHYNFRSIFAWNMIFYNGFFAIVGVYLWMMMEQRMNPYSKPMGFLAFLWRISLTTATGSIFGFLVGRAGYSSALMAPMFVILSFAWGLAAFVIVQGVMYRWNGLKLDQSIRKRMKTLFAVFIAAALYFAAVFHITNLYWAKQTSYETFILLDGGIYTSLFWWGQVVIGSMLPLAILLSDLWKRSGMLLLSGLLVLFGAFCTLYVIVIGGQAYPLEMFPGMEVQSSFFDGVVASYHPSIWEVMLGTAGIGVALLIATLAVRALRFVPQDDFQAVKAETLAD
jgi:molybdopterin-containing oxidoreductase family membrane subunit